MDNNRSNSEFAPACGSCQGPGMPTGLSMQSTTPTIEDVASYNYMNPLQKQQFGQQLKEMGKGHPSIPSPNRMGASPPLMFAGSGGAQIGGAPAPVTSGQFPGFLPPPAAGSAMTPAGGMQMPGTFGQPQRMPASPAAQAALLPASTGGTMSAGALNPTLTQPVTINSESLQYLNGFLRTQIGRPVLVDFLIGTNTLVDKSGTLLGVGVNYILLQEAETDDLLACDFYNIKFIKFYY